MMINIKGKLTFQRGRLSMPIFWKQHPESITSVGTTTLTTQRNAASTIGDEYRENPLRWKRMIQNHHRRQ